MTSDERAEWIRERASDIGFDLCGIVSLADVSGDRPVFPELIHLSEWLERGYAGEMKYLYDARRIGPARVLDGAKSLVVVAINYNSQPSAGERTDHEALRGRISRYAWGDDYHDVILEKLNLLISEMRAEFAESLEARAYVDTGPILERVAARHAGLGWLGKNTLLINSRLGSWLFLGVIITTLELKPTLSLGEAPPPDLCGTCTRCLDACPTQSFPQPYVLDARRCISYLTIELRGSIPEELRPKIGNATIGCDICQDVCPWNRKAPITELAAFQPRAPLVAPELRTLATLTQEEFSALFRGSAVKRAKWRGLVRNACVALGNSGIQPQDPEYPSVVQTLSRLATSGDSLIEEHAEWALKQIGHGSSHKELESPLLERKTP
jgi:epoxyqueuosine reductase